ncbi:MAG TPA: class I SAM-dependent methyltransferase [Streptosporangiaceae bacterium]|nr:class I SAM-dependent methyltransferase [Streptosporangiaceae bacterium]
MNEAHLRICASPEWAAYVESELLPWALQEADLGDDVLEVGPGPGLTTDVLRRRVPRLTAVEIDERLARALAGRLSGSNVEVVHADGTALPFGAGEFTAATLFTMLHHVPSAELQDRLLAEVRRVLRPGGLVVGSDGMATPSRWELHQGDDYRPIDPAGLPARLAAAGFTGPVVEIQGDRFRFLAHAPG